MRRCNVSGFSQLLVLLSLLAGAMLAASPALGNTPLYWDTNGTTSGAGATPTGTWGTNAFWNTDPTGGAAGTFQTATSLSNDLYFVAGPGAGSGNSQYVVTVNGSQSAAGLYFQSSGTAVLSGGTINLGGDGINVGAVAYPAVPQAPVVILPSVTLAANQVWTNNSPNNLYMFGPVYNGGNNLSISGSGNTTLGGLFSTGTIGNAGPGTATVGLSTTSSSTLLLGGGTTVLASNGSAVNVHSYNSLYSGIGAATDAGTYWNIETSNTASVSLLNSASGASGVTLSQSGVSGTYGGGNSPNPLLAGYMYNNSGGTITETFAGLSLSTSYNIYIYGQSNSNAHTSKIWFTAGTLSGTGTGAVGSAPTTTATYTSQNTAVFSGVLPNASGQITFNLATLANEPDINGFQLVPIVPYTTSASISATAPSALDFNGAPSATVSGNVNLATGAALTLQNTPTATLNGNIVADGSSTSFVLSAGSGSTPALTLGASTINVAAGGTLTLPATTFTPAVGSTVTLNGGSGSGTLVLTGSTTVTPSATLNVNGGQLQMNGTLTAKLNYASPLSSTLAGQITGAASTLTVNNAAGTLVLANPAGNSYGGGTTVTAGVLQTGNASGSATGSGPVTIGAGGTLLGGGAINAGANMVTVNGTLTPHSLPTGYNTMTITTTGAGALQLNSGSTLNLNFQSTSAGDLINLPGTLDLGSGTINVDVANLTGSWAAGAYPFLDFGSLGVNGSPAFNVVNSILPGSISVSPKARTRFISTWRRSRRRPGSATTPVSAPRSGIRPRATGKTAAAVPRPIATRTPATRPTSMIRPRCSTWCSTRTSIPPPWSSPIPPCTPMTLAASAVSTLQPGAS